MNINRQSECKGPLTSRSVNVISKQTAHEDESLNERKLHTITGFSA